VKRPATRPAGRLPCVAIDGPVAAGKSTIARLVARELGYTYIDTGAMYRALAWAARKRAIGPHDAAAAASLLDGLEIRLAPGLEGADRVRVDGEDVTADIRSQEIGQLASQLSELPEVRGHMVSLQQAMAREGGVVMEGRDIQTVVLPDAEVKIFLIASPEERARRRCQELLERGISASYDAVLADLKQRDERDANRAHAPLRAAPDAACVNTDGLSIEQVVARVLQIAKKVISSD
jgi:cytidylate kinase